jgi:hypothetical protein
LSGRRARKPIHDGSQKNELNGYLLKYSWDDKSGIVTLVARKDSSIRKFRIKNEARLIMLTPEGKPMAGDQRKYTLAKRAIFAKACFGHPSPSKRQKLNATG